MMESFKIELHRTGRLNGRDPEETASAIDAIESIYPPEDKVVFRFGELAFTALLNGDISDSWLDLLRLMECLKSDLKKASIQFPSQTFWHYWEFQEVVNDQWEVKFLWSNDKENKIMASKKLLRSEFQKLIDTVESDLRKQAYDPFEFREYQNVQKSASDMLMAWRKYPEPLGGNYYAHSFRKAYDVQVLFRYCKTQEAVIYAEGWSFLQSHFGLQKLFEIDKTSQWFNTESLEEWLKSIFHQALLAGWNIQSGKQGVYSEADATFQTKNGVIESIDWDKVIGLKDILFK